MAEIPLDNKQVWVLMTQVARFGQGHLRTIARRVLDGMAATGMSSKDLLYSRHSNRFYRLLFMEDLSVRQMQLWLDIIDEFFFERNSGFNFKERYWSKFGHTFFAEKYTNSNMGEAIEKAREFLDLNRHWFEIELPSPLGEADVRRILNWAKFYGTVDEFLALDESKQYELLDQYD